MKIRLPRHLTTLRIVLLLPLALAGCGAGATGTDAGSEPHGSGGTNGSGGASSTGGGSGGSPTASGGTTGGGGDASGMGGVTGTGGTIATGGAAGGSTGTGAGGVTGAGEAGGNGSGGTTGTGAGGDMAGHSGTGGSGAMGGHGGAGGNPATGGTGGAGSIPTGYPTPTPQSSAVCMSVAQTTSPVGTKVCPGGGDGPVCVECLFGGSMYNTSMTPTPQATMEAGNYAVTVTLGGAAAGSTQINAETNRVLLSPTSTSAGQSVTYAFVVNVRAREGQPTENTAAGYPGLDLFFSGPKADPPEVSAIGYAPVNATTKPVMVYIASDSTACDQTDTDYAGWGEALPQFFAPPVGIANYADSGESSVSFLANSAEWGAVKSAMTNGDWVLIQFGHNDKTTSSATFQANITRMVEDAKAKGTTPVLVSPPARATYSGGTLTGQSGLHSADMQAVAKAQNVPYIDLTSITTTWYNQLGPNGWQQYHALGTDATHTNAAGAIKVAGFVAGAIKSQSIGLGQYLRN